jgi:uncharacterized membrane protein
MVLLTEGLVVWLHLVAASIWVGGSIFLGVILIAPATAATARIRTIRRVVKNIQCSGLARRIIELKLY